ncbi:type IV pilin, partial [Methanoregula sp.]|uniref:type IV pilin n=1 Tax=Methanoregula sp. TaxID=2052170 RepID=UPI0026000C27
MDCSHAAASQMGMTVLIAVVTIGVAIAGVAVISKPQAEEIPAVNVVIENWSKTIYVYHRGGEPLDRQNMLIMVNGEPHTADFISTLTGQDWTTFRNGDVLTYD